MEAGDGQSIINYFKEKQSEDPMFFLFGASRPR